jgi:hypothetical protein
VKKLVPSVATCELAFAANVTAAAPLIFPDAGVIVTEEAVA